MPGIDVTQRIGVQGSGGCGPIILLIEDNTDLLEILKGVLARQGFYVLTAPSAEKAIPHLLQQPPDIVISDVMLPGQSGYDLHRELRRNPEWYDIPFIFLTALNSEDDVGRGRMSGCDDYITKPFNPEELIAIVKGRLALAEHRRRMEIIKLEGYRKRVLNTLSHEFRTPLVAIKTGAELLADRSELQLPELKSLLDTVTRGGQRLERLVNNFLLLQQVELGQAAQTCQRFRRNMSALLLAEMALDSFREAPADGVVHFHDQLGDHGLGVVINVYDVHVVHAIHHVLSNAVKFAGSVGPVQFSVSTDSDHAIFSVRDRGPGLPEDKQDLVVQPFIQVDREIHEQQGAGLGLTVAKYFVEMNGGLLEFRQPEDGVGLDAQIRFPRIPG